MNIAQFVILALAMFRITRLIIADDGPWDVLARVRKRLGIGEPGEVGFWDGLLSCPWCVSIWLAPLAIWAVADWGSARWLLVPLAASAATGLAWLVMVKLSKPA